MSAPPFQLRAIDHLVLIVEGLDRAVRFYGEVLGAAPGEESLEQFGMVQLRCGASMIDIVDIAMKEGEWARPEVRGGRNVDHFAIDVGPVEDEAMRAHLASHGVEIIEEGMRSGAKGNDYSWYIRDPWGHTIELKRSQG